MQHHLLLCALLFAKNFFGDWQEQKLIKQQQILTYKSTNWKQEANAYLTSLK